MAGRGPGTGRRNTDELEPVVAEHGARRVVAFELEAVDRHSLLRPAPALNADVARRDVPATVVHGHADGLALPGHRNRGEHDDEPGITQAVVDPAGAEHRVLHLDDEGVVGAVERFVAVGQRDL